MALPTLRQVRETLAYRLCYALACCCRRVQPHLGSAGYTSNVKRTTFESTSCAFEPCLIPIWAVCVAGARLRNPLARRDNSSRVAVAVQRAMKESPPGTEGKGKMLRCGLGGEA